MHFRSCAQNKLALVCPWASRNLVWPVILACSVAVAATAVAAAASDSIASDSVTAERPNFVWILSEDNSQHYLQLYNQNGAATPRIEQMAREGLVFDHAFSCAPVCSVARTTLITGVFAPRLGTQFHRKLQSVPLPDTWRMFPAYLRDAGYYTTNNAKKDYNASETPGVWDASSGRAHWRNRPSDETPFFHMQTFTNSHESSLHFSAEQWREHSADASHADVQLFPYHPDTPLFRYTVARYHQRIKQIDDQVGKVLDALRADGLLEDTFVFYFGDHGGVLPRSKGYLYESGLHVPLVVRIPERWRERISWQRGQRVDQFVRFVDFAPTVLALAGLEIPPHMDGYSFHDPAAMPLERRNEVLGYADRFDEKYEMVRSLRKGNIKYIRNFQAYYPDSLQNNYRYNMLAYQQWRTMFHDGELNAVQQQFFQRKPAEALYDLSRDPHETRNLANDPEYHDTLVELRHRLEIRLLAMPDLSLYPESQLVERALDNPIAFGKEHQQEMKRLLEVAQFAVLPFDEARPRLERALLDENPWIRYWALTSCAVFGKEAAPLYPRAKELLDDQEPLVRVRAAEFLGGTGAADPRPTLYDVLDNTQSFPVALLTLNAVVYLRDGPAQLEFDWKTHPPRLNQGEVARRWKYLTEASAGR